MNSLMSSCPIFSGRYMPRWRPKSFRRSWRDVQRAVIASSVIAPTAPPSTITSPCIRERGKNRWRYIRWKQKQRDLGLQSCAHPGARARSWLYYFAAAGSTSARRVTRTSQPTARPGAAGLIPKTAPGYPPGRWPARLQGQNDACVLGLSYSLVRSVSPAASWAQPWHAWVAQQPRQQPSRWAYSPAFSPRVQPEQRPAPPH